MFYTSLFLSFIISFSITYLTVPFLCFLAQKLGILDIPDGRLKNHVMVTPYLGGIAVFIGFISSAPIFFSFEKHFVIFFIGLTVLLLLGLIDDIIQLKPYQKLIGQIIAVFIFLKSGFILEVPFLGKLLCTLISFFWFLFVINAFNLVDVMDGLATILALTALSSFFVIALLFSQNMIIILLSALIGSLLAFFWYNKPPASIYLGDAGSLFIGGCCAAIPFLIPLTTINPHGYIAPVGILGIVLLEGISLIIIRIYKGIPFYLGSPDHFSIYLQQNGMSKWNILLYTCLMSIISASVALLFVFSFIGIKSASIAAFFFLITWFYLLI